MDGKFPAPVGPTPLGGVAAIGLSTLLVVWASPPIDTAGDTPDISTEAVPLDTPSCPAAAEHRPLQRGL